MDINAANQRKLFHNLNNYDHHYYQYGDVILTSYRVICVARHPSCVLILRQTVAPLTLLLLGRLMGLFFIA